jgi:hypothetical protein
VEGGTNMLRIGKCMVFIIVQVEVEEGEKICNNLEQGILKRFLRRELGRCQKTKLRGENLGAVSCINQGRLATAEVLL